jgi:hypothetical protein
MSRHHPTLWPLGLLLVAVVVAAAELPRLSGQVLEVGPGHSLKAPAAAAEVAKDGAMVLIDAGIYLRDVAVWTQNDLLLVANGGRVRLMALGQNAEGKAIWVIKGTRVQVEGIEFSGARAKDLNGAGIRFEGDDLTVSRCRFSDNEMGILTSNNGNADILIEQSELYRNTVDYRKYGRLGHNIYIGRAARFELRYSYVHSARTGHQVKSRARRNIIHYNRIADESGRSSYLVDLAEGGAALISGNLLHKSVASENEAAIAFATEAHQGIPGQELYAVHNTLVTDRPGTVLLNNHSSSMALVAGNLVQGDAIALKGPGRTLSNLILPEVGLQDAGAMDYRLTSGSLAIDAGSNQLRTPAGKPLVPRHQYRHPLSGAPRPSAGPPDLGAYEYTSER